MKTMLRIVVMLGLLLAQNVVLADGDVFQTKIAGKMITEHRGEVCPKGDTKGCYDPATESIYYAKGDPMMRHHEVEHVFGMRHTEWKTATRLQFGLRFGEGYVTTNLRCAQVTEGGYTDWKIGDVMCLWPDGEYRKDPTVQASR